MHVLTAFDIYGVRFALPFVLPGARSVDCGAPDLVVEMGQSRILPVGDPPGTLVLDAVFDGVRSYAMGRDERGFHVRVPSFGDLDLDLQAGLLRCSLDPATDPRLFEVLLTGMVPALYWYLRGEVVLHASGVTMSGTTIAVVGQSGMGKSTLAALFCGAGATLVGDDVMCVHLGVGHVRWWGRSPELRLREEVASVVDDRLRAVARRVTADGRLAVSPPPTTADGGALGMIVVPFPAELGAGLSVRRIPRVEALGLLAACPRLTGWRDQDIVRRQFEGLVDLVEGIPVLEARIPWGPPFQPGLVDRLWPALVTAARGEG